MFNAAVRFTVNPRSTVGLFDVFPVPSTIKELIPLDRLTFDCETKTLTLVTRSYGRQTIIPDVMELVNIKLSLSVALTDATSLAVMFSGDWIISQAALNVQVMYRRADKQFDIDATISGVNVDFVALANELTGLTLPNPYDGALTFSSFEISGEINSDNDVTLVVEAKSSSAQIYLIYKKPSQGASQAAIAADFTNYQFGSLILQALGVDLSGIPYFGALIAPEIGITISTAAISRLPRGIFADSDLLTELTSNGIARGTCGAMKFEFIGTPIKVCKSGSPLNFVPMDGDLNVASLLSAIPGVDFNSIPLPFDLNRIADINVDSFSLSDDAKKALCIMPSTHDGLSLFDDLLRLDNANVNLCLSKEPSKARTDLSGDVTVAGTTIPVQVSLDDDDKYVVNAFGTDFPIGSPVFSQLESILG